MQGYADGVNDANGKITNHSLITKIKLLVENTILLCMAIGIIMCFVAIVVQVLKFIFE